MLSSSAFDLADPSKSTPRKGLWRLGLSTFSKELYLFLRLVLFTHPFQSVSFRMYFPLFPFRTKYCTFSLCIALTAHLALTRSKALIANRALGVFEPATKRKRERETKAAASYIFSLTLFLSLRRVCFRFLVGGAGSTRKVRIPNTVHMLHTSHYEPCGTDRVRVHVQFYSFSLSFFFMVQEDSRRRALFLPKLPYVRSGIRIFSL